MTVKELIAELECHDPEQEVVVVFRASDHWRTDRAERFTVEEALVQKHTYFHDEGRRAMDQESEPDAIERAGSEEVLALWART